MSRQEVAIGRYEQIVRVTTRLPNSDPCVHIAQLLLATAGEAVAFDAPSSEDDDRIADLNSVDVLAHCGDSTCIFVAKREGKAGDDRHCAIHKVQVRMAEP